jgi:hypothetical protein
LAAKGKEKEGHFWCKEEIDLDLQKIKNQSWKGKKENRSMARRFNSWFYLICFFFLAGLATSSSFISCMNHIPFISHHSIVLA